MFTDTTGRPVLTVPSNFLVGQRYQRTIIKPQKQHAKATRHSKKASMSFSARLLCTLSRG